MTTELILQPPPAAADLHKRQHLLQAVRQRLSDSEAALEQQKAQLKIFEARYLGHVGALYAEIDEIEARIAEREVALYDSDSARRRAEQARKRAQETHEAAFVDAAEPAEVDPPPSLKSLFREVARRIHPDFAANDAERQHFTSLMARANQAYSRCDLAALERMLDDARDLFEADDPEAERMRLDRLYEHALEDLSAIEAESLALTTSEIGQLEQQAQAAAAQGRDLLSELALTLHAQIADAQERFLRIDRQIAAHGR